jgi:hypothetical protein
MKIYFDQYWVKTKWYTIDDLKEELLRLLKINESEWDKWEVRKNKRIYRMNLLRKLINNEKK